MKKSKVSQAYYGADPEMCQRHDATGGTPVDRRLLLSEWLECDFGFFNLNRAHAAYLKRRAIAAELELRSGVFHPSADL